ncbi:hypothetical protein FACS1894105_04770 [Clostridia bacterium]|nr:hypothetical protein FACS1894105_04770 [Clostridia bacterium]GHV12332.1 hypothetical protein FACS1894219_05030 [Clostridia bacterium]
MDTEKIERSCDSCEFAHVVTGTGGYICRNKGFVRSGDCCKHYALDPFKITPRLPAKAMRFTADDFRLL